MNAPKRLRFQTFLLTAALLVFGIGGCLAPIGYPGKIAFSPDGKQVAYLWTDTLSQMVVDGRIPLRIYSVHWRPVSGFVYDYSAEVGAYGDEFGGYVELPSEIQWSPGGKRIGVLLPNKFVIVDVGTGRARRVENEYVTSFAWFSDDEVAYCVARRNQDSIRRVICRLSCPDWKAREVVALPESSGGKYFDHMLRYDSEWWSPSGWFVAFIDPQFGGRYCCVDAATGRVTPFGQDGAVSDIGDGVAWSPDSTRVLCKSGRRGVAGDDIEVLLLDAEKGTTKDCSASFHSAISEDWTVWSPVWTADGRYVLINGDAGGYLLQPDPWNVIQLNLPTHTEQLDDRVETYHPWLFPLPVAGWVGTVYGGDYSAVNYASDKTVPLFSTFWAHYAISPDGTRAAAFDLRKHLQIIELGRWWETDQPPRAD
jgi:hypothetical protein